MATKNTITQASFAEPGFSAISDLDEYFPHYQPIIKLSTGEIAGYEALARRFKPVVSDEFIKSTGQFERQVVSAGGLFFDPKVPKVEKLTIDRFLREQAIGFFAGNNQSEFLTINISPDWVDLLEDNMISPTVTMIERMGLDPKRVIIEITERTGNLHNLKRMTEQYHNAGFKVAVDDFGTGASQIDRLIALQPDFIKLDRTLFRAASLGGPEADVILAIADIAPRAGCEVICEGIETEEEFHFAIECGADYIQGWLFQAAEAELKPSGCYQHRVNTYKQSYLSRKSERYLELANHNRNVAREVERLGRLLDTKGGLDDWTESLFGSNSTAFADWQVTHQLGVLRFYLCDCVGQQVTANFEIGANSISVDASKKGRNWSHRPYFPLLHAMHQLDADHMVVSDPYKDIVSGEICKTFGVFLGAEQVLLIDVLTSDGVLFQQEPLK